MTDGSQGAIAEQKHTSQQCVMLQKPRYSRAVICKGQEVNVSVLCGADGTVA